MSAVIDSIEQGQLRRIPRFRAGDRVRVHFEVVEGNRRRTQVFEGVVIKRQGSGARETFTVRKQSFGVGVERTFPAHSPKIEQIEVAARGDVRRAKLYYLRDRVGRAARVRERRFGADELEGTMPPPEADGQPQPSEVDARAEAPDTEAPDGETPAAETPEAETPDSETPDTEAAVAQGDSDTPVAADEPEASASADEPRRDEPDA